MAKTKFYCERKLAFVRDRAARIAQRRGASHHAFLHLQAAETIGERLAVTEREFNAPALLFDGPFAAAIARTIQAIAPNVKGPFRLIPMPEDNAVISGLEPGSSDLIVSVFDAHRTNDISARFLQINMALKPDGLFHAAIPVEGTLREFQDCLMRAELEVSGGAAKRFDLFPEIRQAGNMLLQTGFKLPVCDVEPVTIRYASINRLLEDMRGSSASSATAGIQPVLSRQTFALCRKMYENRFSDTDGRFRVTVNIGFLSGWKAHESQQKPLKPGSAKQSLKDFL